MPFFIISTFFLILPVCTFADSRNTGQSKIQPLADSHAPSSVMGDHTHQKGEWMFSYRYMRMEMQGSRIDSRSVSQERIVTTEPNIFFGLAGQPPTLRVVPTDMSMDMHMIGVMYAPSNSLTLMVMSNYQEKEMDHITFAGGFGTITRGTFKTKSDGIGDLKVSGLISLFKHSSARAILGLGFSFPTGSTSKRDTVLTPTGATPTVKLPYGMQNGSGSIDFLPSLTYSANSSKLGWGLQWNGTVRTQKDSGWNLGDRHELSGWLSYRWIDPLSSSIRLKYQFSQKVVGRDANITLPVQTADPDNYGGNKVSMLFGLNWIPGSSYKGLRLSLEAGIPVHQSLNGPQMEEDFVLSTGIQYPF